MNKPTVEQQLIYLEGRIAELEDQHVPALSSYGEEVTQQPVTPEPEWTRRQWNVVNQLRGMVLHLQGKLNEHTDKKKKVYTII